MPQTTAPRPGAVARDIAVRALLPGLLVWLVVVGIGELLAHPLSWLGKDESTVNADLAHGRTPLWNSITAVWSHVGNTEIVIGVCVVACGVVYALTRRWWLAIVPAIAVALQATIFVLAAALVARARPNVPKLDPAPPTSSYPSGHVGASTALYLSLILLAARIRSRPVRTVLILVCATIPVLVAYARLYRGMHHVSDVAVGAANGTACALLAKHCIREA